MIKNIQKEGNILFAEVTDWITKEDVESVIPLVEEMLVDHKKINMFIHLNELKGYTVAGFFADFGFYLKHKDRFHYVAVVGDKEYEKAATEIFDNFMPGKVKYFDVSNLFKAKEWIKQAS